MEEWRYILFNDLEQSIFQRIRVSGNLKDQFYEFGAVYASMTGIGSAVNGIFEQEMAARPTYESSLHLELPAKFTPPAFTRITGFTGKADFKNSLIGLSVRSTAPAPTG